MAFNKQHGIQQVAMRFNKPLEAMGFKAERLSAIAQITSPK